MSPEAVQRLEQFAEELLDDDRYTFTFEEAEKLAEEMGYSVPVMVIRWFLDLGLTMVPREPEKRVRGYRSNPHDRWTSSPSYSGSGWEQITGFAGEVG